MAFFTVIIRISCCGRSEIFFEVITCLISFSYCDTNKTLSAIHLLLVSSFLQSFACAGKSMAFHSHWFMKEWIFFILCGYLPICSWFSAIVIASWKQFLTSFFGFIVAFFIFKPFRRIYVWSTTIDVYLIA